MTIFNVKRFRTIERIDVQEEKKSGSTGVKYGRYQYFIIYLVSLSNISGF